MSHAGLTERQAKALIFIQDFIDRNHWSPSFQEILEGLQLKSKENVSRIIDTLVERGYIEKRRNRSRSIVILRRVSGLAAANSAAPPSTNLPRYQEIEEILMRTYAVFSGEDGEHPAPHEDTALRWLAVAMTSLPDDRSIADRLRRFSGALAYVATQVEKKTKSAA